MMLEHASIAIVLGLPFFSLAMIAADAVFLPTNFLRWLGQQATRPLRRSTAQGAALPGSRQEAEADTSAADPPPVAEPAAELG